MQSPRRSSKAAEALPQLGLVDKRVISRGTSAGGNVMEGELGFGHLESWAAYESSGTGFSSSVVIRLRGCRMLRFAGIQRVTVTVRLHVRRKCRRVLAASPAGGPLSDITSPFSQAVLRRDSGSLAVEGLAWLRSAHERNTIRCPRQKRLLVQPSQST